MSRNQAENDTPIDPIDRCRFLKRSLGAGITAATGNTVSTSDAVLQPDLYGTGDFLIEFITG